MDLKSEEISNKLMKTKIFDNPRYNKQSSLDSSFSVIGQAIISGCDNSKTPKLDIRSRPQSACCNSCSFNSRDYNKTSAKICSYKQSVVNQYRNSLRIQVKQNDYASSEVSKPDNKVDGSPPIKTPSQNGHPSVFLNTNTSSNKLVGDNEGKIFHFTTNLQNSVTIINSINPNEKCCNENTLETSTIDQGGTKKQSTKNNIKQCKPEREVVKKKLDFSQVELDGDMYKYDIRSDFTDKRNSAEGLEKFMLPNLSILKEHPTEVNNLSASRERKNLKKLKTEKMQEIKESGSSLYSTNPKENQRKNSDVSKEKKTVYEKQIGCISGFSGDTFRNLKKRNEDKLSISINYNLTKDPKIKSDTIPKVHFFAIYDGHGGQNVAILLQNQLYKQIFADVDLFLFDPEQSILNGFSVVEQMVKDMNDPEKKTLNTIDNSGSCAIIVINLYNRIYVVNLGDSRAIISLQNGLNIHALSTDHKPYLEKEKKRIIDAGGEIIPVECHSPRGKIIFRIYPGGLAVSRSIGDLNAKIPKFGGIEGVIIAEPEILSFDFNQDMDFIVIGSDGLFDKLNNKDIAFIVLKTTKECITCNDSYGTMLEKITYNLITEAQHKESKDNISCIFLCLHNLYKTFLEKGVRKLGESLKQLKYTTLEFANLYHDETTKKYPQLKPALTLKNKSSFLRPDAIFINQQQSSVSHINQMIKQSTIHTQNPSQIEIKKHPKKVKKCRGFSCCGLFK